MLQLALVIGASATALTHYFESNAQEEAENIENTEQFRKWLKTKNSADKAKIMVTSIDQIIEIMVIENKNISKDIAVLKKAELKINLSLEKVKFSEDNHTDVQEKLSIVLSHITFLMTKKSQYIDNIKLAKAKCSCKNGKLKCTKCHGKGERCERVDCEECLTGIQYGGIFSKTTKCSNCVGGKTWGEPTQCNLCAGEKFIFCKKCEGSGRKHFKTLKKLLPSIPKPVKKLKKNLV